MQSKYDLRFDSYPNYVMDIMKEMKETKEFADVTLICEDGKYIKAHKNVLSASSAVIKSILKLDDCPSSKIFLRGISYNELVSLIEFIYLGEVKIYEGKLEDLLKVAESLRIKQLERQDHTFSGEKDQISSESLKFSQIKTSEEFKYESIIQEALPLDEHQENFEEQDENEDQAIVQEQDQLTGVQCEENDFGESEREEKEEFNGKTSCLDTQSTEMDHTEHVTKSIFTLKIRKKLDVSRGDKFPCSECPLEFSTFTNLNKHKRTKHEGRMFYCDQCEFKSGHNSNIKRHVLSKHMGIRVECDQCDSSFVSEQALILHLKCTHESLGYDCEYCDFSSLLKERLSRHISKRHKQQHQIKKQKVYEV